MPKYHFNNPFLVILLLFIFFQQKKLNKNLFSGDDEAPTVVLARIDNLPNVPEPVTVAEGVVTPDPFRDVIRTEPPPNLDSLMGDIKPYLTRRTTVKPYIEKNETTTDNYNFFDSVFKLFLPEEKEDVKKEEKIDIEKIKLYDDKKEKEPHQKIGPSNDLLENSENNSKSNVTENNVDITKDVKNAIDPSGLLKLAGCNIYGRMYRVGRIISELSGPCLECMCTEVGVQCKPLKC